MSSFSTLNRESISQRFVNYEYDVLVIGGGITGAGIALDAASRGLKVALVDKQDFGAGTSSRSTKLIHGGLRYLKQLEVALVMEVGREREILYRNCPHLVVPEKMLLPLIKKGTYGRIATSLGLWVYDMLAGVKESEQRVMLSKEETLRQEPLLRQDILEGGGLYIEYRTDDARLTMEVIKTAVSLGADSLNYVKVTDFIYDEENIVSGAKLRDEITGKAFFVKAKKIVNSTGPWVDEVRKIDKGKPQTNKHLHLTKGVHLVVPHERFPLKQSLYFDVPGGRMIFAIPRGEVTYLGTTDTTYSEDINNPRTSAEDVDYLLMATNTMFPAIHLTREDIISSWAGLRPLIHEEGKSPSELSRKDEIFVSESGLISIAGGKLTGFRKMAERVTDLVMKKLHKEHAYQEKVCFTDQIVLSGGDFERPDAIRDYIYGLVDEVYANGLTKRDLEYLVSHYGTNTRTILDRIYALRRTEKDREIALAKGELWYCIHHEMVTSLNDFFIRRTGRLYFGRNSIGKLIDPIAAELASYLRLDEKGKARLIEEFKKEYEGVITFVSDQKAA